MIEIKWNLEWIQKWIRSSLISPVGLGTRMSRMGQPTVTRESSVKRDYAQNAY